jgi:molecular chaperone GrpE
MPNHDKHNHPPAPGNIPKPQPDQPQPLAPDPTPTGAETAPALEQQVAGLQGELDDLQARLLRATADYQNLGRRAQRDVAEARQQQLVEVARALISVLDHFDRALEVDPATVNPRSVLEGVRMVHDELTRMLEQFGIHRVEVRRGDPFDPTWHEAMLPQDEPGVPAGHIVAQLQPGYAVGDRVLRPAKVSVAP